MNRPYLSIIIPAYNEAHRIPETLASVDAYLSRASYAYEIIVSDDGSQDGTPRLITAMERHIANLSLVAVKKNQGKGAAVRRGMRAANGALRLFMDADNATAVSEVAKMLPYVESTGYDVIIGSRAVPGAELDPPEPWHRRLASYGLNRIVQALLLPGIADTQCGFKLFTRRSAEFVFSRSKADGWGFDVEVLALARRGGYRIKEVPVHWENRRGSHVTASAGLVFLRDVVKTKFGLSRGEYRI